MSFIDDKKGYRKTFDADDPFWSDYNKLNQDYRNQLDPYLNYNYKSGWWDSIGDFFGFRTKEDSLREQMQLQARAQLASLQNDVFQNDYNSASERASRMRDAGLNPDLEGQVDGESAAQMEHPLNPIDPSVFDPPANMIPDVVSIFGTAASALSSVGTFSKLLADIGLSKSQKVATEISTYGQALDEAFKYMSTADPHLRFPDLTEEDDVTSESFFNQKLAPSLVSGVSKQFSHLSPAAQEMMKKAVIAQSKNPAVYDAYYKNYKTAAQNRIDYLAAKKLHGNLEMSDQAVWDLNKIIVHQRMDSMKQLFELTDLINSYNIAKTKNDFNYEQWCLEHHVSETVAEDKLQEHISAIARQKADKTVEDMRLRLVKYLDDLEKKSNDFNGDVGLKYLYYAVASKLGYAPLESSHIGSSVLGSASWQHPLIPGEPTGLGLFPAGSTDNLIDTGQNNPYWNDLK